MMRPTWRMASVASVLTMVSGIGSSIAEACDRYENVGYGRGSFSGYGGWGSASGDYGGGMPAPWACGGPSWYVPPPCPPPPCGMGYGYVWGTSAGDRGVPFGAFAGP